MHRSENIVWQELVIKRSDREKRNGHSGFVIWFTGLSGSGKSTLAVEVERQLFESGCNTYTLDGDNVRHGLNKNLDFSFEGRVENIRRIGEVAKLFVDAGIIVCTAFISPYKKDRDFVRELIDTGRFIEVFVDCPIKVCESRDPKGLYKKARAGEIADFTGISSSYEAPERPEIRIDTDKETVIESADKVLNYLIKYNLISQENK
ncbi:MAG: adenylyl-sulfate kinase [Chlamydiae bacterium]|nr:MAG: adenylyl-sulfate kinase [Chlamydiota bacterium]